MPQATLQSSPELTITLDKETTFTAGETICGRVIRKSHIVDPDASIIVRLYGRAEVKIHFAGGMTQQTWRSCFNLFGGSRDSVNIHQGPLHIPPNSPEYGSWPFAIILPTHPDPASLLRDNADERSYLPLGDVSSQALPPTFYVKATAIGRVVEGYVQYYLEATLLGSGKKKYQATQPFSVRPISSPGAITDFDTQHRSEFRRRIVSQRLVPGMDSKLSVGQQMKKFLGSSKVPGYSFSLQLDIATVLQIGNPHTIPLRLRIKPIWEDTSEILNNVPQTILVKQFTLRLVLTTHYTSKRLRAKELQDTSSLLLANHTSKQSLKDAHIGAPTTADILMVPQDDASPPLDLGIALGIRASKGSQGEEIYPTFTTYNMKNEHHLEWELELALAGEVSKHDGKQQVTVMGPS
ncbi:hypothetical protein NUU61_001633 [Penicillium alfredii]|uniref:Arrestin-like N-terminal domain-containing protein n=1 Tax=Penicillium alfredii TaxID=1506179 RepID=A0A9W9FPY2_9EURO|nr:uncharacterized protein NUU61_001633 [Penicillium alfredii]KAJ5104286.1 hypothetical protein NUU61_001633 [Penicillium alfredii]